MSATHPQEDPSDEFGEAGREVYDEADQAALFQMAENAQALAKVQAKILPEAYPGFDGATCVECGDDIPPERLSMGRVRCVACQSALEARSKLFASREEE